MRALERRLDHIQAALPEQQVVNDNGKYHLEAFTDESERERFLTFWEGALSRLPCKEDGSLDYRNMAAEDFFTANLWMGLYRALRDNDQPRANGYRYRLSFTTEQVIAMFLSLSANGETDDELHWYTPCGLVYSHVKRMLLEDVPVPPGQIWTPEQERMRYVDEAWHWCIHAGLVEPLYHQSLKYQIEYHDKGRIRDREKIRAMYEERR